MKHLMLLKRTLLVLHIFYVLIILLVLLPGVFDANMEGWPRGGGKMYGFPKPYLWNGPTSLSYVVYIRHFILDVFVYLWASSFITISSYYLLKRFQIPKWIKISGFIILSLIFISCFWVFLLEHVLLDTTYIKNLDNLDYFSNITFDKFWRW